jgi:hypothetical protein
MTRPVVLIEPPYQGGGTEAIRYLACCGLDSVLRGECPIASHGWFPLFLPENVDYQDGKTGREIGLECRDTLAGLHESWFGYDTEKTYYPLIKVVAYLDLGESSGMQRAAGRIPELRHLQGKALEIWKSGEWPCAARWTRTNEGAL